MEGYRNVPFCGGAGKNMYGDVVSNWLNRKYTQKLFYVALPWNEKTHILLKSQLLWTRVQRQPLKEIIPISRDNKMPSLQLGWLCKV